jgi:nucleoside-diphosphate-sugar epimerase
MNNTAGVKLLKGKVAGNDPMRRQPDITRAKEILSWVPKISLEEGLNLTIPHFSQI